MTATRIATAVSVLLLVLGAANCFQVRSSQYNCRDSRSQVIALQAVDFTKAFEQENEGNPSSDPLSLWGKSEKKDKYWFDQRIHTVGNIGIGGGFHAWIAPFATRQIDRLAYGGLNLRLEVSRSMRGFYSDDLVSCCPFSLLCLHDG